MKRKYFITLIIICITTFSLSSCLTSFASSPHDINRISKLLSKNEGNATTVELVPQSSKSVYKTVRDYLNSNKNQSVVRYKYSQKLKQYNHYDWEFMLFPNNRQKGAYVAVDRNLLAEISQLNITMIYITPTEEGETEIKVFQKNPSSIIKKDNTDQNKKSNNKAESILDDIISRLPSTPQSQLGVTTDQTETTTEIDEDVQRDITNNNTREEEIEIVTE